MKPRYRILNGHDEDVLGGTLSPGNVYISTYAVPFPGEPLVADLKPGERTSVQISLSGGKGSYYIERVQ